MSLLNVFKDFEYEDEDDNATFFQDTFSQLLDEPNEPEPLPPVTQNENMILKQKTRNVKAKVEDFEEAYTVLKSIEAAHEPLSCTSMNSFIHHARNIQKNKRTIEGLVWPEHPTTLKDSRLICDPPNFDAEKVTKRIPKLLKDIETDDDDDDDEEEEENESVGLCKIIHSKNLHKSLLRTVNSIYNHKTNSTSHLDPRLSHSIARRTAFLLQSVFIRSALNRRSAVRVLKQFQYVNEITDVDEVTSNWETIKIAAEQLIGQAALNQEIFNKFSSRLDKTFKK